MTNPVVVLVCSAVLRMLEKGDTEGAKMVLERALDAAEDKKRE